MKNTKSYEDFSAHDALLKIQALEDGLEWAVDTIDRMAKVLEDNGYALEDI